MLSKLVYLELTDNYLLLSKIKKKGTNLFLNSLQEIPLKNLEFKNGILFNLSATFLHIKNFLKTNKLKNPKTIVCIPSLQNISEISQNSNVLQIALCLYKSGLRIEKMVGMSLLKKEENMQNYFEKKELEKQLDFFKPFRPEHKPKLKRWAIICGTAYFLMLTTIYIIQKNKNTELAALQAQNCGLLTTNTKLEEKIAAIHGTKKKMADLSDKIAKIKSTQQKTRQFENILISVASLIPQDCVLSKIKIEPIKDKKPTQTVIKLEGSTDHQEQISLFLQKLSQKSLLTNLKIAKIQKLKNEGSNFFFQINGVVKKSA